MATVVDAPAERSEFDQAQAEHGEARSAFKQLEAREAELSRPGALTTADLAGKRKRSALTPDERAVALEEVRQAKIAAARRLGEARERLAEAKVAQANERLPELAERHAGAAALVEARRRAFEQAAAVLIAAGVALGEAAGEEARIARELVGTAAGAVADYEEAQRIKFRGHDAVPLAVDVDGATETRPRPELGVFGKGGDTWNPRREALYEELGRAARAGRKRIAALPERGAAAVRRELARLDANEAR
jgi:hypothetical protein